MWALYPESSFMYSRGWVPRDYIKLWEGNKSIHPQKPMVWLTCTTMPCNCPSWCHANSVHSYDKNIRDMVAILLTVLSTMYGDTPHKQNSSCVHFSYFWLPYSANKSTTCAAASTGTLSSILLYRVSTAEKDSQPIRLLNEITLSLFQGHSLYGGSPKHNSCRSLSWL